MDLLKFCCCVCDLDFVFSNFKIIPYLSIIIAFKLVLRESFQILLPRYNPVILSLAVSCFGLFLRLSKVEKVPRGIQGEKSSKEMTNSRNLVSTIIAQASPKKGHGTRCPER